MTSPFIVLFLNLGSGEIALVVLLIIMFFGTDKLPEMARAIGKGMRDMKNATAEIQREIEKGATEIQGDLNLKEEISEIKKATDRITGGIKEGIVNIEEHHNSAAEEVKQEPDTPENNPLVPPDAIKRD
jgi:sec-independent protein translocase protein TatA